MLESIIRGTEISALNPVVLGEERGLGGGRVGDDGEGKGWKVERWKGWTTERSEGEKAVGR